MIVQPALPFVVVFAHRQGGLCAVVGPLWSDMISLLPSFTLPVGRWTAGPVQETNSTGFIRARSQDRREEASRQRHTEAVCIIRYINMRKHLCFSQFWPSIYTKPTFLAIQNVQRQTCSPPLCVVFQYSWSQNIAVIKGSFWFITIWWSYFHGFGHYSYDNIVLTR